MNITQAKPGELVTVRLTDLAEPTTRRLAELGLRPGQRIMLRQRTGLGGFVIGIGSLRLALDRATAVAIKVTTNQASGQAG